MTIDLTGRSHEIYKALRTLAEERADFVYTVQGGVEGKRGYCHYERDAAPSCIVGHVLYALGTDVDTLAHLDSLEETGFGDLVDAGEVICPDEVTYLLAYAQMRQDCGADWSTAVTCAFEALDKFREQQ